MSKTTIATIILAAGAIALAAPTSAATKECRHIQARKERNLCYEEQAKAKQKKPAPAARSPMDVQIEQMERENQRVQQRLRNICRGC